MKLIAIAAVTPKGVIGMNNELPWRLPEDLRRFKEETKGHAVIMGRKTWESLPFPLPDRYNIVVASNFEPLGDETVPTIAQAIFAGVREGYEKLFVIGGAQIYKATLPICDEALITRVDAPDIEGDAFFSDELLSGMARSSGTLFKRNLDNPFDMVFERWVR